MARRARRKVPWSSLPLDSTVKTPEGLTEKDMFARAKAPLGDLAREVLTDKGTELWKAGRWDD